MRAKRATFSFCFFFIMANSFESQIKAYPIIFPSIEIIWKVKGKYVFDNSNQSKNWAWTLQHIWWTGILFGSLNFFLYITRIFSLFYVTDSMKQCLKESDYWFVAQKYVISMKWKSNIFYISYFVIKFSCWAGTI